jgi:hypothetical protein
MNRGTKGGAPDPLPAPVGEKVTRLKQQIALGQYRVDAEAVAREILFKMRLVSLSRRVLLADTAESGGQQSQPPGGRS